MQSALKKASRRSRIGSAKLDSGESLSDVNNEGVLYMKRSINLKDNYVKTWCTLKDKLFSVYEKKDGNKFEEINIEVCKITKVQKYRSNNFYFRFNNDAYEFKFGTKNKDEHKVWMKKFQYITSNINKEKNVDQNDDDFELFTEVDEGTLPTDKTDSIDNFDLESPDLLVDIFDFVNDNENSDLNNLMEKKLPPDTNKFKLIRDLERQIRDKSIWLSKIDDILRKSHIPHEIDLFYEEYEMKLL